MKQFQTAYSGEKSFRETVSEWKARQQGGAAWIHIFSDGAERKDIEAVCAAIDELMPDAEYVGASASGCIYGGCVSTEKLVVSCTILKNRTALPYRCFSRLKTGTFSRSRTACAHGWPGCRA